MEKEAICQMFNDLARDMTKRRAEDNKVVKEALVILNQSILNQTNVIATHLEQFIKTIDNNSKAMISMQEILVIMNDKIRFIKEEL